MTAPAIAIDLHTAFPGMTPAQLRLLRSPARYRFFVAGRGAGKSWAITMAALFFALQNPRTHGCIGGRTQKDNEDVLLVELYAHLARLEEVTGISWVAKTNANAGWLRLINGATIHWRGYDRRGKWRGPNLGWAVIDEICWAERSELEIWEEVNPSVRVKCPRPGIVLASSPNGYRGVVKMFADRQRVQDPDFYAVRATSFSNPHIDRRMIEAQIATMSKSRVAQEIYAIPLRPANTVYPAFSVKRHVVAWREDKHADARWVLGIDWGMTYAYAGLFQVTSQGIWCLVDELAMEPGNYVAFRDPLVAMVERHMGAGKSPRLVGTDRAVKSENAWLRLRWIATEVRSMRSRDEQAIRTGINLVGDMLDPEVGEPRLLISDKLRRETGCRVLGAIDAFQSYRWSHDSEGNPIEHAVKDNVSDHANDAIRYGIMAARDRPEYHGGRRMVFDR